MGLLELTLLAALVVALAAAGRVLLLRHQANLARDAAETTLKEMLGDKKYSERSFDILHLSVEAYGDEETRDMLREIGAEQIDDGGRELWTLSSGVSAGSSAGAAGGGKETMPSA